MPKEYTLAEVGEAVGELQHSIEKGTLTEEKSEKLDIVLNAWEDVNQERTKLGLEIKAQETTIVKFKEELEAKGVEAGQMREAVDKMEIALAKSISDPSKMDPKDTPEYKAFNGFVMGDEQDIETKAELRTDLATEGGVLVTSEMENRIVKQITEMDDIRRIARVRPTSKKSLVVPIETAIPVATYEGEAETSAESVQTYGSETLTAYRLTHTVPITRDMLMDSSFDMDAEILDASARAFAFGEGSKFVDGNGSKNPLGFLQDSRITQHSSISTTGGAIGGDDILMLQGKLKVGYTGTLVMNRVVLSVLRREKNGTGSGYLWTPALDGPAMSTMGGSPYIVAPTMPDNAADSLSVAYGDFGIGYLIVDRTATEIIRDDFTRKKEAIVEFTIHRWNTGKVVLPEAIKLLKLDTVAGS